MRELKDFCSKGNLVRNRYTLFKGGQEEGMLLKGEQKSSFFDFDMYLNIVAPLYWHLVSRNTF